MKISTFCFINELGAITALLLSYTLNSTITAIDYLMTGWLFCACIVYTYTRWQEVIIK